MPTSSLAIPVAHLVASQLQPVVECLAYRCHVVHPQQVKLAHCGIFDGHEEHPEAEDYHRFQPSQFLVPFISSSVSLDGRVPVLKV